MLKLSKKHQFKITTASDDDNDADLLGADLENDELQTFCKVCGKPTDNANTCIECMETDYPDGLEPLESDDDEAGPVPYDNEIDADKLDARREAATPHAHAARDLFTKRRELMGQVNMLDDQLSRHREVLRALDPRMKHEAYADDKELRNYLKPEKLLDDKKKKKRKKLDKHSGRQVVEGLLKVAEVLDYAGDLEGVSLVENVLRIFAKKDEDMPKYNVETVEKIDRRYPEMAKIAPSMSTRNCPDHNGIQMKRVAEGTFQCELDGRMYNWNQGFKDYNGSIYPSAPIRSVDFPDTMERMFETREMATNKKTK